MRTTMLVLIAALIAISVHTQADAKDEPKADVDTYVLFRVAGRKWMHKRTPKAAMGFENNKLNYQEYEVTSYSDDRAEVSQLSYDQTKQPSTGDPIKMKIEFSPDYFMFKDPLGYKKTKTEKIKTDGGTFECTMWTSAGGADGASYMWRSNDFPGLIVKQDDAYGTTILVEFTWVDGDPGYKSTKKKRKGDDEEIDPKRLYSNKGASWIHRADTKRGERGTRSIEITKYEVKKVSDEECELEITKLTQLLQKLKGEDEEVRIIKFDSSFEDNLKPIERSRVDRTEKRITEVGMFTCTVYTYKDADGHSATAWYANEWPGLLVRREVEGEDYHQLTEIIKFED